MKITSISAQQNSQNRVNISVDGKYRLSLDIAQVGDLGIRVGDDISEPQLVTLEEESSFGKLYIRALEYALIRPRSQKEMRDYLWRKTLSQKLRVRSRSRSSTGQYEIIEKPGFSQEVTERVYQRLVEKGYIDDERFARFWIENRNQTKGSSLYKLRQELALKGVERELVDQLISASARSDKEELQKVIAKKRAKYANSQRFVQYLQRQGFSYEDITKALEVDD